MLVPGQSSFFLYRRAVGQASDICVLGQISKPHSHISQETFTPAFKAHSSWRPFDGTEECRCECFPAVLFSAGTYLFARSPAFFVCQEAFLNIFFEKIYFYVYVCACTGLYIPLSVQRPVKVRRGRHISCNWSYR